MLLCFCKLLAECVVIKAHELSMHWASDFSFRPCSSRYLVHRFNLERKQEVPSWFLKNKNIGIRLRSLWKKLCILWSSLPYLLSDLLHYTLQSGGHSFNNFFLIVQLSVHFIMQPLRRMTFHSTQHRTKRAWQLLYLSGPSQFCLVNCTYNSWYEKWC